MTSSGNISLDLAGTTKRLDGDGLPPTQHLYDRESLLLVSAALTVGRPLLLRGEPGSGKSQLARAAARALGWAFASLTLDARSEAPDLCWEYDAVRRLATAQVLGAIASGQLDPVSIEARLAVMNFVEPRPLWWAFDWKGAQEQFALAHRPAPPIDPKRAAAGWVVLLDEMDKADPAVPNGLLDVLGHGEFRTPEGGKVIAQRRSQMLVVVTTNEERPLPNAFLRRCLVLRMGPQQPSELQEWLTARARAHFPDSGALSDAILARAIAQLLHYRRHVEEQSLNPPGLAELIDLLRAVVDLNPQGDAIAQGTLLDELAPYALLKHSIEGPTP